MKLVLGREVGLGPGDFMLDGDPAPSPKRGRSPPAQFLPITIVPNGWMDQHDTWHGARPRHRRLCVRWRTSPPSPIRRQSPPIFGPCLLWPNGWMDQDATWYGGRPRPTRHCVRCGPISPATRRKRVPTPNFWPMSIVTKWLDGCRCRLVRK